MPRVWISRPYYYFNDLGIVSLICEKRDPKVPNSLDGSQLFVIYEQLLCYAIQFDGVIKGATPYMLANYLRGNFHTDEIEYAINRFVMYGLVEVNENHHINFIHFSEFIKVESGSIPDGVPLPGSSGSKAVKSATIKNEVSDNYHSFTNKLIELGYLTNANATTITKFEEFFKDFKIPDELDEKEIRTILVMFWEDVKKTKQAKPDYQIKDRFGYFTTSFAAAITARIKKKKMAGFTDKAKGATTTWSTEELERGFK